MVNKKNYFMLCLYSLHIVRPMQKDITFDIKGIFVYFSWQLNVQCMDLGPEAKAVENYIRQIIEDWTSY